MAICSSVGAAPWDIWGSPAFTVRPITFEKTSAIWISVNSSLAKEFVRDNLCPSLYIRQLGTLVPIPDGNGPSVKVPRWKTPVKTTSGQTVISAVAGAKNVIYNAATEALNAAFSGYHLCGDTNVSGTLNVFGGFRPYNDSLMQMNATDWMEGALESLTRELAVKIDRHALGNISGTSNLKFAGTTKAQTGTPLKASEIAKMAIL